VTIEGVKSRPELNGKAADVVQYIDARNPESR